MSNIALADLERLSVIANSERPLLALPARRQIIEWAKSRDNFESDGAFERATELAAAFCRAQRSDVAVAHMELTSRSRSIRAALAH